MSWGINFKCHLHKDHVNFVSLLSKFSTLLCKRDLASIHVWNVPPFYSGLAIHYTFSKHRGCFFRIIHTTFEGTGKTNFKFSITNFRKIMNFWGTEKCSIRSLFILQSLFIVIALFQIKLGKIFNKKIKFGLQKFFKLTFVWFLRMIHSTFQALSFVYNLMFWPVLDQVGRVWSPNYVYFHIK